MKIEIHVDDFNTSSDELEFKNEYLWELFINHIHKNIDSYTVNSFVRENTRGNFEVLNTPYDPEFWRSYNLIPFTEENRKAFRDLSITTPIEEQFIDHNLDQ